MATFTIEEIADAMRDPELVRNFTIAANVDAGKSTFSDSMLCYAGLINKDQAGDKTAMDTMKIEQERGITIKSVGVSMLFNNHGKQYIMNMVDSPGHIDFSAEVTAAVRVSDGVFVLLDPVDGVMAQTRTVLSQALTERVVPCLMINKVDKLFLSLQATPDEIYNIFVQNIVDVNNEIDINQDPDMVTITRDQKVDPVRGNVMFSSAYHTWGFTLKTFAKIYEPKMPGMSIESIMKKLWQRENFCNMIIKPIYTVLKACNSWPEPIPDDKEKNLKSVIAKLGITLKPQDFDLRGKALMRKVMGAWLPIAPTAVEMAVEHLPSPKTAQAYRAKLLYTGEEDEYLKSIRECNPNGPLIVYISKMIPSQGGARFSAFGRVFSGTARSGKVKVLLPTHNPSAEVSSSQKTYVNASVQKVVLMMASRIETIDSVPAGNIMALDGVDNAMVKSGTIVDENAEGCHRLQNMDFSVAPIVRYSLVLNNPAQLPKFTETLKKYVKSDPCLLYVLTEEGEHLLCGSGELHLETAIEILRSDYMPDGITFRVSEPIVSYCETVTTPSTMTCLSKSPNKHNRLFCTAQPLDEALINEMITGTLPKEAKERARHLIDTYGFDESARKIWKLAPEINPCNMVIDCTKGVQYMNEIKDSVASGFLHGVDKGPLCDEPLRGVRLNLEDVTLHADAIHRGGGQIIPTLRSVLFASVLTANPRLLEPIFKAEIQLPREKTSSIYGLMSQRRGEVKSVEDMASGNRTKVEATLPVADSFGFVEELRGVTSGTAFVSLCFSHWQVVPGNPLEVGSFAYEVVMKIRKRKDLKLELPKLENYNDKL